MVPRSMLARRLRWTDAVKPITRSARPLLPTATRCPARAFTSSPLPQLATPVQRATTIQAPLPSLSSSVARLLPQSVSNEQLPLPRQLCEDIIGRVLEQVRSAADAKTVEEARAGWAKVDEQIRQDLASKQHPATSLTELTNLLVASSGDPRRHPIAFNMYRMAFGSDPALLPALELDAASISASSSSSASASNETSTGSQWGDWQSSYYWANLVLQGRAPPPPGTYLLVPGEQRAAQASQSAAAYRVFAHLASRGHPQGIFGIGRHLLSTLERGNDPTTLGAMPISAVTQPRTRQETLQEVEKMYRLAGEAGVEDAWFELAALHAEGKWVRKDDQKARSLLREGVDRGSTRACRALAHLMTREVQTPPAPSSLTLGGEMARGLDSGKRDTLLIESLRLLERGAELGSADCAFSAGMRYLLQAPAPEEEGSEQPFNASLDMSLNPSASSKTLPVDPAVRARQEHIKKWAVEPSNELAAKWFGVAAEGGNALAMMNLARMYLEDRVVPATANTDSATSPRQSQLAHASDLYAKILAKAMGPEGQRSKAMAEVQAKMAGANGAGSGGTGQGLDDLGARAQEGLRLVTEEMSMLSRG